MCGGGIGIDGFYYSVYVDEEVDDAGEEEENEKEDEKVEEKLLQDVAVEKRHGSCGSVV